MKTKEERKSYSTQVTIHCTAVEARKLAIDLLKAAEQCDQENAKNESTGGDAIICVHSFGHGASAWHVENTFVAEM